jgi:catechol 2,3-dioxygenase-like lactoylglutathione lyase family enzyme
MAQRIAELTVVVHDYDDALAFYVGKLGFEHLEDTDLGGGKRWVRVRPTGSNGAAILLARAATDAQRASVGNQTGGRVCAFIETDDFRRDHAALAARGVSFVRPPSEEPYGTVAVFEDLHGNRFDLVEPRGARRAAPASSSALAFSRAAARAFGIFLFAIETWRRWHQLGEPRMWPSILDDWLAGAFLVAASVVARRDPSRGRAWLAGAWGAATGMMFGSFFGQLTDPHGPDPSGAATSLVVAVKGLMFALCLAGLVASLRAESS